MKNYSSKQHFPLWGNKNIVMWDKTWVVRFELSIPYFSKKSKWEAFLSSLKNDDES